jgi:hypothetical protein
VQIKALPQKFMKKSNLERTKQLGMDIGTATARLKKNLMFSLIVECGKDICFQCKKKIVWRVGGDGLSHQS